MSVFIVFIVGVMFLFIKIYVFILVEYSERGLNVVFFNVLRKSVFLVIMMWFFFGKVW